MKNPLAFLGRSHGTTGDSGDAKGRPDLNSQRPRRNLALLRKGEPKSSDNMDEKGAGENISFVYNGLFIFISVSSLVFCRRA